jgi:hypothetical protein
MPVFGGQGSAKLWDGFEWRNGEMEKWRNGEMEKWRNGEMDCAAGGV